MSVYAFEQDRAAATGEPLQNAATGEFRESASPMLTVVCTTLRTQKGACLVDPGMGVDWLSIDKDKTGASADAAAKIRAALARYVNAGSISGVEVTVDTDGSSTRRLLYRVAFTDTRLQQRLTTAGTL
jgi:hypothetical protein